jgi:alkyl sulfatase BDS1-like metallo-beta-lactamase superfamily hydrolase
MKISPERIKRTFGFIPTVTFADGICHLIGGFGNCGVVETDEGLVIFDITMKPLGPKIFRDLRTVTNKPIKYIIYSHGHFDHCFGFAPFLKEIKEKGWEMPEVIAHENCVKRFEKYRMLDKYHIWLNQQQFASLKTPVEVSAHETLDPTIIIKGNEPYTFKLGGLTFELYPEWGETDDAIWLWLPEKRVIFAGDLMVSHFPNVGNPYKVQRYPKHWALALERMMEKNPEFLVPGHGELIEGKDKVKEVLSITAEAMNFVHDEVVKRLNEGKWFEQIFHEMIEIFPDKFKNHPYLLPMYGCYEFAIHAVYRLYHGWYDTGNPTDLFPAKRAEVAKEFLKVADCRKFLEQAKINIEQGNPQKLQIALHLLDVIINGSEAEDILLLEALKLKSKALKQKAETETSFIASNIINNGALALQPKIKELKKKLK